MLGPHRWEPQVGLIYWDPCTHNNEEAEEEEDSDSDTSGDDQPSQKSGPQGPKRKRGSKFDLMIIYMCFLKKSSSCVLSGKQSFAKLVRFLKPDIKTKNVPQAKRCRIQGEVKPEVRLAVALRFFAGGQVEDLWLLYDISKTECYKSIWRVIDGVVRCEELAFREPRSEQEFKDLEIEFRKAHNKRYPGGCESWFGQIGPLMELTLQ
jgi:hypothetical protein